MAYQFPTLQDITDDDLIAITIKIQGGHPDVSLESNVFYGVLQEIRDNVDDGELVQQQELLYLHRFTIVGGKNRSDLYPSINKLFQQKLAALQDPVVQADSKRVGASLPADPQSQALIMELLQVDLYEARDRHAQRQSQISATIAYDPISDNSDQIAKLLGDFRNYLAINHPGQLDTFDTLMFDDRAKDDFKCAIAKEFKLLYFSPFVTPIASQSELVTQITSLVTAFGQYTRKLMSDAVGPADDSADSNFRRYGHFS